MSYRYKWVSNQIDLEHPDKIPTEPHLAVLVFKMETHHVSSYAGDSGYSQDQVVTEYYAFNKDAAGHAKWEQMIRDLYAETHPTQSSHARIPQFVFFASGGRGQLEVTISPRAQEARSS